ncbi:MAG: hypothetical protein ACFFCS_08975 [Candidatus Hodarchaeota archaeon]
MGVRVPGFGTVVHEIPVQEIIEYFLEKSVKLQIGKNTPLKGVIKGDSERLILIDEEGMQHGLKELLKEKMNKVVNLQGLLDSKGDSDSSKGSNYILKIQTVFDL